MQNDPTNTDDVINCHKCSDASVLINSTNLSKEDASTCFQEISGDLICVKCGQVLQSNSQLTLDSGLKTTVPSITKNEAYLRSKPDSSLAQHRFTPAATHQDKSEASLRSLARKLISSFALKPAYEAEAFQLMSTFWERNETKLKYGMIGNRLLIAALFLLSRRDHLAVNLSLLAASIDANPFDCGAYFEPLIAIDPELRALAKAADFVPRSLDMLVSILANQHKIVIYDSHLHGLQAQSIKIAHLLEDEETGSSRAAESIALASVWIAVSALLLPSSPSQAPPIDLQIVIEGVCDSASLALKTVKTKHSLLLDRLFDRAAFLLPTSFSLKLTRPKRTALLLSNLSDII